ncbi:hypothetical protein GGGNBK_03530 [Sporosarcina sp. ANT_H38]
MLGVWTIKESGKHILGPTIIKRLSHLNGNLPSRGSLFLKYWILRNLELWSIINMEISGLDSSA